MHTTNLASSSQAASVMKRIKLHAFVPKETFLLRDRVVRCSGSREKPITIKSCWKKCYGITWIW